MRKKLDAEISSATTVNRRDGAVRRFGIPAVVAAAVAALAIGGYLLASTGGDGGGADTDPAGQGDGLGRDGGKPEPTNGPQGPEPTNDPGQPEPTVLAEPDQAYQECVDLVTEWGDLMGEPIETPDGKLAIDNGKGTTVVVANSTDAYTCNIKPDRALSHASPLDAPATRESFAVADNVTSNVLPNDPGEMVWAGGALPDGVTNATYTFPDGHEEQAITQDGYWAMQYFAPKWFTERGQSVYDIDPISVTLAGPDGTQELTLKWGIHTCNQVSHGC